MAYSTFFCLSLLVMSITTVTQALSQSTCPKKCGYSLYVKRDCWKRKGCKLVGCMFKTKRGTRWGKACVEAVSTNPACPERCMDRIWAAKMCMRLPHCHLRYCKHVYKGRVRVGAKCSSTTIPTTTIPTTTMSTTLPATTSTTSSASTTSPTTVTTTTATTTSTNPVSTAPQTQCPEQCIDPRWAEEKCLVMPGCEVVPCQRDVKDSGLLRLGGKCTSKQPECPEKCMESRWAEEKCAKLPGCEVKPCVGDVQGTGTLRDGGICTKKKLECSSCGPGKYLIAEFPECVCSSEPCDACPKGTRCVTQVHDDGSLSKVCVRCDCGYCDAAGKACCQKNKSLAGANCMTSHESNESECKVVMFSLGNVINNAGASICDTDEKVDEATAHTLVASCGCVPTSSKICEPAVSDGGSCVVNRH